MTDLDRLADDLPRLGLVAASTVAVYGLVVLLTRVAGPRSLAKMSSFDFAATVAIGSMIATTGLRSVSLPAGAVGLIVLFGAQASVAALRHRRAFAGAVDNRPLVLMAGPVVVDRHLRQARISREELYGELRAAGVHRLADVRAVVLETTGDLSVLTGPDALDDELLTGVRGRELLQ